MHHHIQSKNTFYFVIIDYVLDGIKNKECTYCLYIFFFMYSVSTLSNYTLKVVCNQLITVRKAISNTNA